MLDHDLLETSFGASGPRLKVSDGLERRRRIISDVAVALDIQRDRKGEFFEVIRSSGYRGKSRGARRPVRRPTSAADGPGGKREAQVPVRPRRAALVRRRPARVGSGRHSPGCEGGAEPAEVQNAQARMGLRAEARNRRKNAAYRRQGEWFFIPVPDFSVAEKLVLHHEPLSRGNGGKPHWAESLLPHWR